MYGKFLFFLLIHSAILSGCSSSQTEVGNPPNAPPQISGVPPTSVIAGDAYSFTPTASDSDNNPLEFSNSGQPNWTSFDILLGSLTGTPSNGDVGVSEDIQISVNDGSATTSLPAFTVTVDPVGGEPPPPDPNPDGFVGFGSITQGADSCPTTSDTYRVTSLSGQSGQGTLRDAVSQGCRLIVSDILLIGFQESLNEDFAVLKKLFGMNGLIELPKDEVKAHKSPCTLNKHLDPTARQNIEGWYANDFELLRICQKLAPDVKRKAFRRVPPIR